MISIVPVPSKQTVSVHTLAFWKKRCEEHERTIRELTLLVYEDGLTGLYNHRCLQKRLPEEVARSQRTKEPLSILMIDLDRFGTLNKQYGHPVMNQVLKDIAAICSKVTRASDVVFRYGGDEIVIVLPNTKEGAAIRMANRLRFEVSRAPRPFLDPLTMSIGVSVALEGMLEKSELLLEQADLALRAAKNAGKDRVVVFSDQVR